MIYIGNLILRTMVSEYFKNLFQVLWAFFRRKTYLVPCYKDRSKPKVQRPLNEIFISY